MSYNKEDEDRERFQEVRDQIIELKKDLELQDYKKAEERVKYLWENYFK